MLAKSSSHVVVEVNLHGTGSPKSAKYEITLNTGKTTDNIQARGILTP